MSGKMSRRMRQQYQKVKTLKPSRSLFDLSHEWLSTCDMGILYPFFWSEMSPGDTFHMANEIVIRAQPLLAPILHQINATTHYFFVPYRIIWEEWENFITGGVDGQFGGNTRDDEPSEVSPELPRWSPTNNSVGSLWDSLGLPTGVVPNGALPLDFIRRVYNRIWNEYYRDENLQEEVNEDNEELLRRNWKKDYFTSALENQQRGIAPALPIVGSALVSNRSQTLNFVSSDIQFLRSESAGGFTFHIYKGTLQYEISDSSFSIVGLSISVGVRQWVNGSWSVVNTSFKCVSQQGSIAIFVNDSLGGQSASSAPSVSDTSSKSISGSYADLSTTTATDVKDLRVAFQIQKWLELANRGGVRYTEFLRSFFGVSPRDSRLQRPEYIGGTKMPIIVSEVLQTSSTDSEPTPQGNMAGHGIGAARTYAGSYTATEFGMVMGLFSIMPETKYQQGINRQLLRRTKFDFLFPQFTHLSEQAIEEAEIYATNSVDENRRVFGFNEIYDELRSIPSKIVGKMRDTFDYWHLARKFDEPPALNSDFIECNPSKRIFAVPSEDGFIVNIGNIIRAVRPLPKYGTPGGV